MSEAPRRPSAAERALAAAAAILGLLALIAGSPTEPPSGGVDVNTLARIVEREDGGVTALEVARWVREGRRGLRVIDVRPADDYDEYHIPGAEQLSLAELAQNRFEPDETVVLYDDEGAGAAKGRLLLRAARVENVYFVRGGLSAWLDQVMEAKLSANARPTEREAFQEVAELSRYFGGTPQVRQAHDSGPANAPSPNAGIDAAALGSSLPNGGRTSNAVSRLRRRGC